mgnify:CR=1 FL=1
MSLARSMLYADDGWEKKVPDMDFDKIDEVEPNKDKEFKFRDETFKSYTK